jgi:hypothetical protein
MQEQNTLPDLTPYNIVIPDDFAFPVVTIDVVFPLEIYKDNNTINNVFNNVFNKDDEPKDDEPKDGGNEGNGNGYVIEGNGNDDETDDDNDNYSDMPELESESESEKIENIKRQIESTVNFSSASEGVNALKTQGLLLTRIQESFDSFKSQIGRNMTYSEMRQMMG